MQPDARAIPLSTFDTQIADTPVRVYYFQTRHKIEIYEVRTLDEEKRLIKPDPEAEAGLKMLILSQP